MQLGFGTVNKVLFCAVFLAACVPAALAQASCSGEACTAVVVATDGCQWTNKGEKAVRLSLSAVQSTPFVTILAPGDTFKQTDKGKCLSAGDRFEASFPALRAMPDETVGLARPRPKPVIVAHGVPANAPGLPAVVENAVVATASIPVTPRAKPALPPAAPPVPKAKPVPAVAIAEVSEVPKPTVATTLSGSACVEGDKACPPILFKVIDSCVWVLNLNPRPVAFEALVAGKALSLALEAADGAKADANRPAAASAALHMRLRDPFQSAGSGIPIYRARLGGAGDCVRARTDITAFTARFSQ